MQQQTFSNDNRMPGLKDHVNTLANEVIDVLRELAGDTDKPLDAKLLSDRILANDTVTQLLSLNNVHRCTPSTAPADTIEINAHMIIDKLSKIIPKTVMDEHQHLIKQFYDTTVLSSPVHLLEAAIKIIRKYVNAVAIQQTELGDFVKQTVYYADEIEKYMKDDQLTKNRQFNEDRDFEDSISSHINVIKYDISTAADLYQLKRTVLQKLEHIASTVATKREQDMLRFRENEEYLDEMRRQMKEMKRDASSLRTKAEEIEGEHVRDALTGLYNRRAFVQKMYETLADLKRYNVAASLMSCEIDSFWVMNDRFGHHVGDLALKKLSSILTDNTRLTDFIARYGGSKFMIIFPHTPIMKARKAADKIRSLINSTEFSYKKNNVPFSISIGLSEFRKVDDTGTVCKRADKALNLARRSGVNTIKTEEDVQIKTIMTKDESYQR